MNAGAAARHGAAGPARATRATALAAAQRAADDVVGVDTRDAAGARLAAGVCARKKRTNRQGAPPSNEFEIRESTEIRFALVGVERATQE